MSRTRQRGANPTQTAVAAPLCGSEALALLLPAPCCSMTSTRTRTSGTDTIATVVRLSRGVPGEDPSSNKMRACSGCGPDLAALPSLACAHTSRRDWALFSPIPAIIPACKLMQHAIAGISCLRETSLLASFGSHPVYLWCIHSVTFSCNHASEATIVEPRPLGKTQRGPDSPVSITPYRWIHHVERQKHGQHASCASIGFFGGFIVR